MKNKENIIKTIGIILPQKLYGTGEELKDAEIYARPEESIVLSVDSEEDILAGCSYKLLVSVSPSIANIPALIWETSDPEVCAVDNIQGILFTKKPGECTISATNPKNGITASLEITIKAEPEDDTTSELTYVIEMSDAYVRAGEFIPGVTFDMVSAGKVVIRGVEHSIGEDFAELSEGDNIYWIPDDEDAICCFLCFDPNGKDIEGGMMYYGINYAGLEGSAGVQVDVTLPGKYIKREDHE